jgi:hypothetical protein
LCIFKTTNTEFERTDQKRCLPIPQIYLMLAFDSLNNESRHWRAEACADFISEVAIIETDLGGSKPNERRKLISKLVEGTSLSVLEAESSTCFYVLADGVGGVIECNADVALFRREARFRSQLGRCHQHCLGALLKTISVHHISEAHLPLDGYGAVVIPGFLGRETAVSIRAQYLNECSVLGEVMEGGNNRGKPGCGRGDSAFLPDDLPLPLLGSLDGLLQALRRHGFQHHASA